MYDQKTPQKTFLLRTLFPLFPLFPWRIDKIGSLIFGMMSALALVIVALILVFLISESVNFDGGSGYSSFFRDSSWNPLQGEFGLLSMVAGTMLTAFGALAVAFPISFFGAASLYFSDRGIFSSVLLVLTDLMAGIPSVVYGFWGLTTLVPWIGSFALSGATLLSGILVLALMIMPTLIILLHSAFCATPRDLVDSVYGMGLGRWEVLFMGVVPSCRIRIYTASILALGRALGETMAVLMVCGNIAMFPSSLLDPVRTLTTNIALELGYAEGAHRTALFVTGLLLACLVIALSLILAQSEKDEKGGGRGPRSGMKSRILDFCSNSLKAMRRKNIAKYPEVRRE